MRSALILALVLASPAALAQSMGNNPAQTFQNMTPQQAAQMNHAVKNDPQARAAIDQVEKELNKAGHPAGKMLEKTR